jgi:hypothetical protein
MNSGLPKEPENITSSSIKFFGDDCIDACRQGNRFSDMMLIVLSLPGLPIFSWLMEGVSDRYKI